MLTRILTSAVGIVILFGALFAPPYVFAIAVFAVTAIMLAEMYKVLACRIGVDIIGYIAAAVIAAGTLADKMMPAVIVTVVIYMITVVLVHTKTNAKDALAHGFATLFITMFMCYAVKLRADTSALGVLWIFLVAWMTDTGAYFSGVFLGKHKLVPHISPKKTVEGAAGGLIICVMSCVIYYFIFSGIQYSSFDAKTCAMYAVMGLIGSTLAQIGDFIASCIKRDYGVKDYGNILPGHGGAMDRFDSVVFIAPFIYYALRLIDII